MKLKLKEIQGGAHISTGCAKVFYLRKEDAGNAMMKLYYEKELGDTIDISYYKSKESLIIEKDRQSDPFK